MRLSDELYKKGKNSKGIFTPINEDYGLVCKSMPVTDEELSKYVSAITRAKADGINIAGMFNAKISLIVDAPALVIIKSVAFIKDGNS